MPLYDDAAALLAARHPERVRTLVAHEPPCVPLLPDAAEARTGMEDAYQTWRSQGVEAGLKRFEAVIGMEGTPPEQPPGPPTPRCWRRGGAHQRQPRVLPRPRHPADQRPRPRRGCPARRPGPFAETLHRVLVG